MTKTLAIRTLLIGGLATLVFVAFSVRTEATGFTFSHGTFTFKIDSYATYNGAVQSQSTWTSPKDLVANSDKFFNISDVKPGDHGTTTISVHVNKNAWICLDFDNLTQKENGRNEPELSADSSGGATSGELADGTEFFAWLDDGDNKFEIGELPFFGTSTVKQAATKVMNNTTYALADSLGGTAFPANQTKYIGITWCAGDLVVATSTAKITCNGTALGNAAQTDSFSVNVSLRAVTSDDQPNFTCIKTGSRCEWPFKKKINNHGSVNNNTSSNSNTGGNNAGAGGTVNTGNSSSSSNTVNIVNLLNILIDRLRR